MAGLINNMLDNTGPAAPNVNAMGVDPEKRSVDAAKETVSGQLDSLLAKDSAYTNRARAGAMQTANKRGLLNSSMAAGAGEAAAIDAALPIANADAQVYQNAAKDNQTVTNDALKFNSDAMNQFAMQGLRGEQSKELADIEAGYKTLMQTNDSAGKLYQQTIDSIQRILTSDMTQEAKQSAVNSSTQLLKGGMNVIGKVSNLDLTSLLNFSDVASGAAPTAPSTSTQSTDSQIIGAIQGSGIWGM